MQPFPSTDTHSTLDPDSSSTLLGPSITQRRDDGGRNRDGVAHSMEDDGTDSKDGMDSGSKQEFVCGSAQSTDEVTNGDPSDNSLSVTASTSVYEVASGDLIGDNSLSVTASTSVYEVASGDLIGDNSLSVTASTSMTNLSGNSSIFATSSSTSTLVANQSSCQLTLTEISPNSSLIQGQITGGITEKVQGKITGSLTEKVQGSTLANSLNLPQGYIHTVYDYISSESTTADPLAEEDALPPVRT